MKKNYTAMFLFLSFGFFKTAQSNSWLSRSDFVKKRVSPHILFTNNKVL
ncbi:hypothetical protein [Peribacillus loiseleuriae]